MAVNVLKIPFFLTFCSLLEPIVKIRINLICFTGMQQSIRLYSLTHSFIHSIDTFRIRRFLAVLMRFFHSYLLYTFSCHPSPSTILQQSLTSSCHLFLDLPLSLVVLKFLYSILLGILFSPILATCPNQSNLFKLISFVMVGFLTLE